MGAGLAMFWRRFILLAGTVYLWGLLKEFYAAEPYGTARYMMTASFIYGGLIAYRQWMTRKKNLETQGVVGNHLQFQKTRRS